MKVRATAVGFDGTQLRQIGDLFEIEKHQFAESWMIRTHDDAPIAPAPERDAFGNPLVKRPGLADYLAQPEHAPIVPTAPSKPPKKGKA